MPPQLQREVNEGHIPVEQRGVHVGLCLMPAEIYISHERFLDVKRRGVFVSPDRSFSCMLQVQLPVVNLKSLLQCINIDFGFLLEFRRNPSEEGVSGILNCHLEPE